MADRTPLTILDHAIEQFLEQGHFVRNWSPKTVRCYSQCLAIFRQAVGELPTKANLHAFVVLIRQQGRSAGGWCVGDWTGSVATSGIL